MGVVLDEATGWILQSYFMDNLGYDGSFYGTLAGLNVFLLAVFNHAPVVHVSLVKVCSVQDKYEIVTMRYCITSFEPNAPKAK